MDYAVKNFKKTSDIEQETMVSKLHNMQWLKNTSHSSNPKKIKAVYKQIQDCDENNEADDKVLLTENIQMHLVEVPDEYCLTDTYKKYSSNDVMAKSNENMSNKDIDAANLFPIANELVVQKDDGEETLSIVNSCNSIVTVKMESQLSFCTDEKQKNQPSVPQNNAEDIIQNAVCSNLPNSQKADQDNEQLNLIKYFDDNNNQSKFATLCTSKINNEQVATYEVIDTENNKASMGAKDQNVPIKKTIKAPIASIKNGSNTTLSKNNRKPSTANDSKKLIFNSSNSLSSVNKNGRIERFNNKPTYARNIVCTKRQEFNQQHSISKNEIKKDTKNFTAKSNLVKTVFEKESNKVVDMSHQNKSTNKDKTLQKQETISKQYVSKLRKQESFKNSKSMFDHAVDKNEIENIEKVTHKSKNSDSPLSESEKKNENMVSKDNFQRNRKVDYGSNFRRSPTFVVNHVPTYRRNISYISNNQRFDRNRIGNVERGAIIRREYTSNNVFSESNVRTEELRTSNLENHAKRQNRINDGQLTNVKSLNVNEKDTLVVNNKNSINPVKEKIHLIENKKSVSIKEEEEEPIMSEQCYEKTEVIDKSKIDIDQQYVGVKNEMDKEETNSPKYSSTLLFNKCIVEPQTNVINQHLLKLENIQHTDGINQLENDDQMTCVNHISDNIVQKSATIVSSQQSIQNTHFNMQKTITETGNQTKHKLPSEPVSSEFYNQNFSASNTLRLSQIPNAALYEYNVQTTLNNNDITVPSTLETKVNRNRENTNVLYRYISNVQQRSATVLPEFSSLSISSDQTSTWSPSMQNHFHVEHPYNDITHPTAMHIYNSGAIGPSDFNNTHIMNRLPQPTVYPSSPCMQMWNPQLQYPTPVFYNSPCTSYTIFPNTTNQINNLNDVGSTHNQQHKYAPYVQMNNYVRDTYGNLSNCVVQTNTAENVPLKSNQYYKNYQDNCRAVYDVPQHITYPSSYPRSQQDMNFIPATCINQCNAYCSSNQRHHTQNMVSYTEMPENPKNQMIQDLICEDDEWKDIPPIISPREFITDNVNRTNNDQFATHAFKPEFKKKVHTEYRPLPSQRYNGSFRRNIPHQDFSKQYTSSTNIGRGRYKVKKV